MTDHNQILLIYEHLLAIRIDEAVHHFYRQISVRSPILEFIRPWYFVNGNALLIGYSQIAFAQAQASYGREFTLKCCREITRVLDIELRSRFLGDPQVW